MLKDSDLDPEARFRENECCTTTLEFKKNERTQYETIPPVNCWFIHVYTVHGVQISPAQSSPVREANQIIGCHLMEIPSG
jgi:hypothetical protein